MMESGSDEAEYLSCCNVCFIKFDLDQFRPKVLPCSHTFCFRCLKAIHTETTLNCPLCRKAIELGEVTDLPNNVYAQHIIELNKQLQSAVHESMHWCFVCESVVKSVCKKKKHTVIDMSQFAKELQSKLKRTKINLGLAVEKRRQLKKNLDTSLALHKAQIEEIKKRIAENSQELNQLQFLLKSEPDFKASPRSIVVRFKETNNSLASSAELSDEWLSRLEAFEWLNTNSGYSWRQKAYLLRNVTVEKNYLRIRATKRTCLKENPDRTLDRLNCFAFHPVKPILVCGFKSGTIGFFTGKKHSSPFSSWAHLTWKLDDHSIMSMEWNTLGNELAFGNSKSHLMIWNSETNDIRDLGYVHRSSSVNIVRWNRKWAPDLLAVACTNNVLVWDLSKTGMSPAYNFKAIHIDYVESMVWMSADKIATCSVNQIKISQLGNSQAVHILQSIDRELMNCLCWNGDENQLATCCWDSGRVILWTINEENFETEDSSSGETSSEDSYTVKNQSQTIKTKVFCQHYGVICLDWYPLFSGEDNDNNDQNEGLLACGTREKLVVILDPVYKTTVRRIPGHTEEVCSVAFSPDGKYLASLSAGKELIIWLPENSYRKLTFYDLSANKLDLSFYFSSKSEGQITWSSCCKMLTLFSGGGIGSEEIRVFEIIDIKQ